MVRIAFSRSRRSLSNEAHVQASSQPTEPNGEEPDAPPQNPSSLAAKQSTSQHPRVPFDPRAIFRAFLEKVPQPPGRPDTPEAIETLKKKGIDLRNRLAALEPLKGTRAWTTDQEAKYYFMDFQRKWILCRCLRINQLVSAAGDRRPGRLLIVTVAHRDSPTHFPPRFMVIHRYAVVFTLPAPPDVGLPEVEVRRHRRHDSVEYRVVQR